MSPQAGEVLLNVIQPMLIATVSQAVKAVGSEDAVELVQDGMVMAAQALEKLEQQGRALLPQSVVYYTVQRLKTGRRSQFAGRMDAMCPAAALDKKVELADLDARAPGDDELTYSDLLSSCDDDAAILAARDIDWSDIEQVMSTREREVLRSLMLGRRTGELAREFGISAAAVCQCKRRIGGRLLAEWGAETLQEVGRAARWKSGLRARRHQCRA